MLSEAQIQHLLVFVFQVWNDGAVHAKMSDQEWSKVAKQIPGRLEYATRHILANLNDFPSEEEVPAETTKSKVVFADFVNKRKL